MKKPILTFFSMLFALVLWSNEKDVEPTITHVTLFMQGAQVFSSVSTELPAGVTELHMINLSPYIDPNTIKITGKGLFTIMAVNFQQDFINKTKTDEEVTRLSDQLKELKNRTEEEETWIGILEENETFLCTNRQITGKENGVTMEHFREMDEYFTKKIESLRLSIMTRHRNISDLKKQMEILENQLKELAEQENLPSGMIVVNVSADKPSKAELIISYMVASAGWYPSYDIRAINVDSPITFVLKANLFQNTGVRWDNVGVTFSNVTPNESMIPPDLRPYYLYFNNRPIQTGEYTKYPVNPSIRQVSGTVLDKDDHQPIPGVIIAVKGTTAGTTSDWSGNYSIPIPHNATTLVFSYVGFNTLEIPVYNTRIDAYLESSTMMLAGVVVTSGEIRKQKDEFDIEAPDALILSASVIKKETTFEMNLPDAITVESTSKPMSIEIQQQTIPASYEYLCIPKLTEKAYLQAFICDWESYHLLSGEANLYFENTYIGKTMIDVGMTSDTMNLSLGYDKNILVDRELRKDFTKHQVIGTNVKQTLSWQVTIRNGKDKAIRVRVRDQVPVSKVSTIEVDVTEMPDAKLDDDTGLMEWIEEINPKARAEYFLTYSVKCPKGKVLFLE